MKTLGVKRIAVIDERTAFGAGLADRFVKSVDANGGAIAFDAEGNLRDPAFTIYRAGGGKWVAVDVLGGVGANGNAAGGAQSGSSGSTGSAGSTKVANASK
ncbi:hypothetical protein WT08_04695 [Burkholderia sp. MSMB1552]|nr:hypothetical protein WT08_04695 [Burkholderia sp. MSMB1552]KWZ51150.1 hypothetical protein WS92_28005 [Burkholderia sp. MSMB1588]